MKNDGKIALTEDMLLSTLSAKDSQINEGLRYFLQQYGLFQTMSLDQLQELLQWASIKRYKPGEVITQDGDEAKDFYVIIEGVLEVFKKEESSGENFKLASLQEGECFGERALMENKKREGTVIAAEHTTLLRIRTDVLQNAKEIKQHWLSNLLLGAFYQSVDRVKATNETTLNALKKELKESQLRSSMGQFIIFSILTMSLYTISAMIAHEFIFTPIVAIGYNAIFLVTLGTAVFVLMKKSIHPLSFFGLFIPKEWKRHLGEALIWSVGLLALVAFLKYILIQTVPMFAELPLIDPAWIFPDGSMNYKSIFAIILYVALCPFQEICTRGALQSSLQEFLSDYKQNTFWAILLSNALFAASHSHLSPYFALLTFVPGCMWGFLYARQKSLLGTTFSHIVVGVFALQVLGISKLLGMILMK